MKNPSQPFWQFLVGTCNNLANFEPDEIVRTCSSEPPRELWLNILPTLWVLQEVRRAFGEPIILTSTYRDRDYNARIGGASNSQHLEFRAIDFVTRKYTTEIQRYLYATVNNFRHLPHRLKFKYDETISKRFLRTAPYGDEFLGQVKLGVGAYDTFTHLDVSLPQSATGRSQHSFWGPMQWEMFTGD